MFSLVANNRFSASLLFPAQSLPKKVGYRYVGISWDPLVPWILYRIVLCLAVVPVMDDDPSSHLILPHFPGVSDG